MAGVYTIIGLSFAPNAFEYYQVILINYKSFPLDIAQKWPKIITMKPRPPGPGAMAMFDIKVFILQIFRGEQHFLIKGPLARFWGGILPPLTPLQPSATKNLSDQFHEWVLPTYAFTATEDQLS